MGWLWSYTLVVHLEMSFLHRNWSLVALGTGSVERLVSEEVFFENAADHPAETASTFEIVVSDMIGKAIERVEWMIEAILRMAVGLFHRSDLLERVETGWDGMIFHNVLQWNVDLLTVKAPCALVYLQSAQSH